ncbi:hypothetical protein TELCIR_06148 [Teladorsagia circumcincta]|uniref:SCP domain-containing protein n=1 Tax=Teladorsagia circumcincta TaxID=45464 RepID=A0A2G9UNT6_TELCI|nr:hypothetical protein TELCIR_06148 [Teladorsagia circumcincta]
MHAPTQNDINQRRMFIGATLAAVAHYYDCALEEKAARMDICKIIPPRERFRLRGRNYAYIETPLLQFRPILSPADALLAMANAKTPGVGCVVDLCRFANDTNLQTRRKYWAVVCLYTKPHVKKCKPFYTKGKPCSMCPCGYRCEKKTKLCKKRNWKK